MKRWKNKVPVVEALLDAAEKGQLSESRLRENGSREYALLYPEEIAAWIAELKLLKGVPLSYLAGDEMQLPPESIRFFYVDEDWTAQMINGALSIGAHSAGAREINRLFSEPFQGLGKRNIRQPRKNCIHENQMQFYGEGEKNRESGVLTGFLLRSRLVGLWKGLESSAVDRNGSELAILRMERLSGEIMLCIYEGEVEKLRVKEPKEGLRFGSHENDRKIRVREVRAGCEGQVIPGKTLQITANDYGRADILSLAGKLKETLQAEKMTSAELAMELMIAPGLAEFQREERKNG